MRAMQRFSRIFLSALITIIAGCGGGGGGSPPISSVATILGGKALISFADAPGDFLAYRVSVTSVSLKDSAGNLIETLNSPERVNFTNLISTAELFESAPVPAGTYTGVHITVDYSNAEIFVQNSNGSPVKAAVQDTAGNPVSAPVGIDVSFPSGSPLVIAQGNTSNLALDFNLAASNTVSFPSGGGAIVKVSPAVSADPSFVDKRPRHLRGQLTAIDSSAQTLTISIIPFDDISSNTTTVNPSVDGKTRYEINGHRFVGADGLAALVALALPVLAELSGAIDATTGKYLATSVIAGTGEGHSNDDGVRGHVLSRTANTLTLIGELHNHGTPGSTFGQSVTVDLSQLQSVIKGDEGESAKLTAAAIGIGQRVQILGTQGTASSNNVNQPLIAAKLIRLLPTVITGTANQALAGSLLPITLKSVDGIAVGLFNFGGTGSSSGTSANPAAYSVDLSQLSPALAIKSGDPVKFVGFTATWNSTPPDFVAAVGSNDLHGDEGNANDDPENRLHLVWSSPGSTAPFTSIASNSLVITRSDSKLEQGGGIRQGDKIITVGSLPSDPSLVPSSAKNQRFALVSGFDNASEQNRSETQYHSFADFEAALTAQISAGGKLRLIEASGSYDSASNTFTANEVLAAIQKATPH